MATLGAMKTRIASEIVRDDLDTEIAEAITTAITIYQKERFRFSDINPTAPPTFNTVADRWIYTSVDNANINTMYGFDYVMADIGGMASPLRPDTPVNIRLTNNTGQMRGQPTRYSYEGNQLLIAPIPDKAYLITLGIFRNIAAPAQDDEANNPWMVDGEELIRSRAKYEIALHVTRNEKMQVAMSPIAPPPGVQTGHATYFAWKRIKGEAARITGTGRVKAMRF